MQGEEETKLFWSWKLKREHDFATPHANIRGVMVSQLPLDSGANCLFMSRRPFKSKNEKRGESEWSTTFCFDEMKWLAFDYLDENKDKFEWKVTSVGDFAWAPCSCRSAPHRDVWVRSTRGRLARLPLPVQHVCVKSTHYRCTCISISVNTITALLRGSDASVSLRTTCRLIALLCCIIRRLPSPLWTHVLTQLCLSRLLNSVWEVFELKEVSQMKRQTTGGWGGGGGEGRGWTFRGIHKSWEGKEKGTMDGCTAAGLKSQRACGSVDTPFASAQGHRGLNIARLKTA